MKFNRQRRCAGHRLDARPRQSLQSQQSLGLYTRFRADGNWHKSHYDVCDLPQATVDVRNAENIRFERPQPRQSSTRPDWSLYIRI